MSTIRLKYNTNERITMIKNNNDNIEMASV